MVNLTSTWLNGCGGNTPCAFYGGAIHLSDRAVVMMKDSTISGNTAVRHLRFRSSCPEACNCLNARAISMLLVCIVQYLTGACIAALSFLWGSLVGLVGCFVCWLGVWLSLVGVLGWFGCRVMSSK